MLSVANEDEKAYLNEQIAIWQKYTEGITGIGEQKDGTDKLASNLAQVSAALMKMGGFLTVFLVLC